MIVCSSRCSYEQGSLSVYYWNLAAHALEKHHFQGDSLKEKLITLNNFLLGVTPYMLNNQSTVFFSFFLYIY